MYPSAILPEWFAGNEFPHHPMNDAAVPPVHVFALDNRTHPAIKSITGSGAFGTTLQTDTCELVLPTTQ